MEISPAGDTGILNSFEMNTTISEIQNHHPSSTGIPETFAEKYTLLREKEQRIYSDEEVTRLPVIDSPHPHFKEWLIRKKSSDTLLKYLQKKNENLNRSPPRS